jgi:hypothetical protein
LYVADAVDAVLSGNEAGLRDHRHDGPRNQVPVVVDLDRNDRLDVENVLRLILGPGVERRVVLAAG